MIGDGGRVRIALCGLTLLVAGFAALGWAAQLDAAKTFLPGLTTMKANTALGLAISAAGLLLVSRPRLAAAAGLVAAAIGAATLLEYASGLRLGLDEALVADPATTSMPFPGRMSPETALALLATGCGIPLLAGERGRTRLSTAHALAVVPGALGYLSIIGYTYGVERLYNFGSYVSIALNTAACLCMLSGAMLLTRRAEGWSHGYRHRPIASKVLVRLIVIALVLPFATGLLIEAGAALGFYQPAFGPALFAMLASLSLVGLAMRAASAVRAAEDEMIAARREARDKGRALDASNARYRYVVENLSQLIWTARADGGVVFSNTRWLAYTGQTLEQTKGHGWSQAVHPDDYERVIAHWHGAVAGRHSYDLEYRLRRHDGAYRWFKVVGMPMIDGEGDDLWIGSNTDVQEIVDAREVLARSREDLERLVEDRTAALMAAEEQLRQSQKMEAVGQLTGGIAHDFNNLLAGITGSLDLLQSRAAKGRYDDVPRFVAAAQGAAKRAASLTHRLLAFSRRQTLVPRPTDINRLVAGMEEMVRRTVGPAIDVEIVAAGGLWNTLIDAGQLENALLNLCINARDAMPSGGKLTVETANRWFDGRSGRDRDIAAGQYVSLCVSDNGTGMPPDVVERAFDPFFTTKPIGAGTGLGLSMIFGFVQQSGGQARIYSEVGQGTNVCLYLPREHADAETSQEATRDAALPRAEHGERVLVVDDEPTVRMFIVEILEDLGYQSLEAADGAAGLRVLQSNVAIDLLITDVGLPGGMNGRQMADAARVARPDLKVLFITGYAENAVLSHGHLDPGMHVITKPFAMDALASRIKALLAERVRVKA